MEFKSLKNIETSFRQIRLFGIVYTARTYARQMIIRESNVTERTLVTACRLLNASRSDDNPNGFTIEGFTVLENKDIRTIER